MTFTGTVYPCLGRTNSKYWCLAFTFLKISYWEIGKDEYAMTTSTLGTSTQEGKSVKCTVRCSDFEFFSPFSRC